MSNINKQQTAIVNQVLDAGFLGGAAVGPQTSDLAVMGLTHGLSIIRAPRQTQNSIPPG